MKPLLQVKELSVSFHTPAGIAKTVDNISFQLFPGEAVAIVGESGCGKSVTAHSLLRLVSTPPGSYDSGQILFEGTDILKATERELETIRGNTIAMIFQDALASLNPVLSVGVQIAEPLLRHQALSKQKAKTKVLKLLQAVGIPSPEQRFYNYPHQFSGGMRQRAVIAMALACSPKLLIADEPTTALDVTLQAQILDLLKDLQGQSTAILFISHDLGAVARLCSRVIVMYAGTIVETGTARNIFKNPQHPYTRGLLHAVPRLDIRQTLTGIEGQPPNLLQRPGGCPFHPRCSHAMNICACQYPALSEHDPGHTVHCWLQHPQAPGRGVASQ